MIGEVISFIGQLIWAYVLYRIGMKESRKWLFYVLLYIPAFIALGVVLAIIPGVFEISRLLGAWILIVLIAIVTERIAWGVTLRELSGETKLAWFYVAYLIPLFGWLLYRITK